MAPKCLTPPNLPELQPDTDRHAPNRQIANAFNPWLRLIGDTTTTFLQAHDRFTSAELLAVVGAHIISATGKPIMDGPARNELRLTLDNLCREAGYSLQQGRVGPFWTLAKPHSNKYRNNKKK